MRFKLLAKKDNCTMHTVDKVRKLGGKIRRWRRDLALSHLPTFSYCCCATLNLWLGLMQPLYLTKLATLTPFSGCQYYLCLECKKKLAAIFVLRCSSSLALLPYVSRLMCKKSASTALRNYPWILQLFEQPQRNLGPHRLHQGQNVILPTKYYERFLSICLSKSSLSGTD